MRSAVRLALVLASRASVLLRHRCPDISLGVAAKHKTSRFSRARDVEAERDVVAFYADFWNLTGLSIENSSCTHAATYCKLAAITHRRICRTFFVTGRGAS